MKHQGMWSLASSMYLQCFPGVPMGFPYTEVSPVLRSLQSSPVSVPLYNNLWLTSLSPCVCVCVRVCVCVGCTCMHVVATSPPKITHPLQTSLLLLYPMPSCAMDAKSRHSTATVSVCLEALSGPCCCYGCHIPCRPRQKTQEPAQLLKCVSCRWKL